MKYSVLTLLFGAACAVGLGAVAVYAYIRKVDSRAAGPITIYTATPSPTPGTFSLDTPPSRTLTGTIATFSGTLSWESRTATAASKIHEAVPVVQGGRLVTGDDGNVTVTFPDDVTLTLMSKTDISVIQTLPASMVFLITTGMLSAGNHGNSTVSIRSMGLLSACKDCSLTVSADTLRPEISLFVNEGNVTAAYNDRTYTTKIIGLSRGRGLIYDDASRTVVLTR
ncbi:hypothetical protein M1555_01020 [Patescibacteria group bacterium]|nr:hypothetical protein [Patescibacteria group bacterium]